MWHIWYIYKHYSITIYNTQFTIHLSHDWLYWIQECYMKSIHKNCHVHCTVGWGTQSRHMQTRYFSYDKSKRLWSWQTPIMYMRGIYREGLYTVYTIQYTIYIIYTIHYTNYTIHYTTIQLYYYTTLICWLILTCSGIFNIFLVVALGKNLYMNTNSRVEKSDTEVCLW